MIAPCITCMCPSCVATGRRIAGVEGRGNWFAYSVGRWHRVNVHIKSLNKRLSILIDTITLYIYYEPYAPTLHQYDEKKVIVPFLFLSFWSQFSLSFHTPSAISVLRVLHAPPITYDHSLIIHFHCISQYPNITFKCHRSDA